MNQPKYRKDLNNNQKDILLILYKFRFATVDLIVQYQGLKLKRYTFTRLEILAAQKYIGRHRSKQDKIDRKPATYFLLPEGIKVLRAVPGLNQKAFTNMYDDRKLGHVFIDKCLQNFQLYIKLNQLYGSDLTFYGKTEMSEYLFFPKPLPEGYVTIKDKTYMLDVLPALTTYPALRGRVDTFIKHFEAEEWDKAWKDYPAILLICETPYLERLIQKLARRALLKEENKEEDVDGLIFLTTTTKAFFRASNKADPIWSDVLEPEELLNLI